MMTSKVQIIEIFNRCSSGAYSNSIDMIEAALQAVITMLKKIDRVQVATLVAAIL